MHQEGGGGKNKAFKENRGSMQMFLKCNACAVLSS